MKFRIATWSKSPKLVLKKSANWLLSLQDEMVAVAEKAVLRVVDLLDWLAPLHTFTWARGAKGIAKKVKKIYG